MLSQEAGKLGEELAADFLRAKDYEILERNLRLGRSEIDLLAKFNGYLVVVEVKTKASSNPLWQAEQLLNSRKYQNLLKATSLCAKHYKIPLSRIKLELVVVSLNSDNKANISHYTEII